MNELITVIINVYNGEKYIQKCLDSIINQTYKNIEILIINDGSTDNTLKICQSYKDKRIRIINQQNMGLSLARNVGIDNAKGEYLYFIDVDDLVEKDVIEYLYNLCKTYNTKMSTCRFSYIFNYNYKVKNKKEKIDVITNIEMLKNILCIVNRSETLWNKLIKKELFNNIRFENRIINDIAVTYKLAIATDKIAYSNQIKYYYLINNDSINAKAKENLERYIDMYNVGIERYNYIKNIYPKLAENDIGLCRIIAMIYNKKNAEIHKFLDDNKADELFKELFSFKMIFSKMRYQEKIKILSFRINPKLSRFVTRKYADIKKIVHRK